jgi:hypothetical protein
MVWVYSKRELRHQGDGVEPVGELRRPLARQREHQRGPDRVPGEDDPHPGATGAERAAHVLVVGATVDIAGVIVPADRPYRAAAARFLERGSGEGRSPLRVMQRILRPRK